MVGSAREADPVCSFASQLGSIKMSNT
jgi:hypothetical protein